MRCLYRHLQLHSDAAQSCIFSHCGHLTSSVRLQCRVGRARGFAQLKVGSWCVGHKSSSSRAASEVWAASEALFEKVSTMATAVPPGPLPGPPGCLCIPRSSLFSGLAAQIQCQAVLWSKWGPGICSAQIGECSKVAATSVDLSLP